MTHLVPLSVEEETAIQARMKAAWGKVRDRFDRIEKIRASALDMPVVLSALVLTRAELAAEREAHDKAKALLADVDTKPLSEWAAELAAARENVAGTAALLAAALAERDEARKERDEALRERNDFRDAVRGLTFVTDGTCNVEACHCQAVAEIGRKIRSHATDRAMARADAALAAVAELRAALQYFFNWMDSAATGLDWEDVKPRIQSALSSTSLGHGWLSPEAAKAAELLAGWAARVANSIDPRTDPTSTTWLLLSDEGYQLLAEWRKAGGK